MSGSTPHECFPATVCLLFVYPFNFIVSRDAAQFPRFEFRVSRVLFWNKRVEADLLEDSSSSSDVIASEGGGGILLSHMVEQLQVT